MEKIFSLDNPFFRFMERVADFFILNILTIICSIPVFTVGAALTAHHKVMQNLVLDFEQPVIKSYFQAFAGVFKQATVLWLATALFIAVTVVDVFLIYVYLEGIAQVLYVLLAVVGVLVFGTACYAFAMIARYENSLKKHLCNSFVLALGNLPRTLLMLLLWFLPLLLALISLSLFLDTLVIWAFFGISLIVYAHTRIIMPVFLMLEQADRDDGTSRE